MYCYVGKGTSLICLTTPKNVESVKPGDIVLSYYVGVGPKRIIESRVKSIRKVGKGKCKMVGSLLDAAYICDKQFTINEKFKRVKIEDVVYSVGGVLPRPIKIFKEVDNIEIYELELEDTDATPLLSSYLFVVFTDEPISMKQRQMKQTDKQVDENSGQGEMNGKEEQQKQKQQKQSKKKSRKRKQSVNTENTVSKT